MGVDGTMSVSILRDAALWGLVVCHHRRPHLADDRNKDPRMNSEGRGRSQSLPPVRRLLLHPIKSLDAQEVDAADVLPSGALAHDRTYAIVDTDGRFVNGKRHAAIHRLRSHLDFASGHVSLRDESDRGLGDRGFDMHSERSALCAWLSAFFGFAVSLIENRETGFPDDPDSPGPTIISTATLAEIGRWFDLPVAEVRARFRTNIEIEDVPPFWEDVLFGDADETPVFTIGATRFMGINPCQRCNVPPRNPRTGANDPTFAKRFAELRRRTLPAWSTRTRFNHFYRVAVNTRIDGWRPGASVRVGDELGQTADAATWSSVAMRNRSSRVEVRRHEQHGYLNGCT